MKRSPGELTRFRRSLRLCRDTGTFFFRLANSSGSLSRIVTFERQGIRRYQDTQSLLSGREWSVFIRIWSCYQRCQGNRRHGSALGSKERHHLLALVQIPDWSGWNILLCTVHGVVGVGQRSDQVDGVQGVLSDWMQPWYVLVVLCRYWCLEDWRVRSQGCTIYPSRRRILRFTTFMHISLGRLRQRWTLWTWQCEDQLIGRQSERRGTHNCDRSRGLGNNGNKRSDARSTWKVRAATVLISQWIDLMYSVCVSTLFGVWAALGGWSGRDEFCALIFQSLIHSRLSIPLTLYGHIHTSLYHYIRLPDRHSVLSVFFPMMFAFWTWIFNSQTLGAVTTPSRTLRFVLTSAKIQYQEHEEAILCILAAISLHRSPPRRPNAASTRKMKLCTREPPAWNDSDHTKGRSTVRITQRRLYPLFFRRLPSTHPILWYLGDMQNYDTRCDDEVTERSAVDWKSRYGYRRRKHLLS